MKQSKALKRIISNAQHGIDCNDHELMNPDNYKCEMEQHCKDVEAVKEALKGTNND